MKLETVVPRLVEQATEGMNSITNVPSYDALKPVITQAITEIAEVLVKYAGAFEMDAFHIEESQKLMSMLSGTLSGMLIKLTLSEKDLEAVMQATLELQRQLIVEHIASLHEEIPLSLDPKQLN